MNKLVIIVAACIVAMIGFHTLREKINQPPKGDKCPKCNSTNVGTFIYGFIDAQMDSDFWEKCEKGIYILGGCKKDSKSPRYRCNDCGYTW